MLLSPAEYRREKNGPNACIARYGFFPGGSLEPVCCQKSGSPVRSSYESVGFLIEGEYPLWEAPDREERVRPDHDFISSLECPEHPRGARF